MMEPMTPRIGWLLGLVVGCNGTKPAPEQVDSATPDTAVVPVPEGAWVLDNVRVVDPPFIHEDAAVVIVSDEVHAVLDAGGPWEEGTRVDDLSGHTVMPGLIDAHVHLFLEGTLTPVGDHLADNLRAQLAWGVVGVADLGAPPAIFGLRDRIAAGELVGPRIWATGPFVTVPGSHPCERLNDPLQCRFIEETGDAARIVEEELSAADGIKVAVADAAFTPWPTPRIDSADLVELAEQAHAQHQLVVAHTDTPHDVTDALTAGVDLIAHPPFDAPGAPVADAAITSTLGAFSGTPEVADGSLLSEDLRHTPDEVVAHWTAVSEAPAAWLGTPWLREAESWSEAANDNVAEAIAAGAPVLAGTDAGYLFVPHGVAIHRELEALVVLGMTPLEAITAATQLPARFFGWDDLGQVAPGYRADLVVVAGRPDEDIRASRAIEVVLLGGEVFDPEGILRQAAGSGPTCLEAGDCPPDHDCDLLAHTCQPTCAEAWDLTACDADSACLPADLGDSEAVCVDLEDCDLLNQDCSPEWYGENCVPVDLDTNRCWPAGPKLAGESCSWDDPGEFCAQGHFCSWVDNTCYTLCDIDDPADCPSCTSVEVEGTPWFAICLD